MPREGQIASDYQWRLHLPISSGILKPAMKDPANTVLHQNVVIRVDANIAWQWRIALGGNYVAVCDPLKITLQSPTWPELMEDISNTLDALLKDLIECNEFEQFMHEHGWKSAAPIPPRQTDMRFEVPFSILPYAQAGMNGSARNLPQ